MADNKPASAADIAALVDKIQQLEAKLAAISSAPAAPARPERLPGELSPEDVAFRAWLQRPFEERVQEVADGMFAGPKRFACYLVDQDREDPITKQPRLMRDCPTIKIAANSPEEARARYLQINGIRHTEKTVVASLV
jgi:hypothetical protein